MLLVMFLPVDCHAMGSASIPADWLNHGGSGSRIAVQVLSKRRSFMPFRSSPELLTEGKPPKCPTGPCTRAREVFGGNVTVNSCKERSTMLSPEKIGHVKFWPTSQGLPLSGTRSPDENAYVRMSIAAPDPTTVGR